MRIHNLELKNSLLNQFISEIRDETVQKDSMRFRRNLERVGEVIGYELSKTLEYREKEVLTPLGKKNVSVPVNDIVLCAILRAGLPLHQGLLNYFDKAENAFISAFRSHKEGSDEFDIVVKYLASPSITDKTLILVDPMLATGRTLENVRTALSDYGKPKKIHIVSVIGSKEGVDFIKRAFPENTELWIASVDDVLNARGYIVPGLGDAGDLAFGLKR